MIKHCMVHCTLSITAQSLYCWTLILANNVLNFLLKNQNKIANQSPIFVVKEIKDISAAGFGSSDDVSTFSVSDQPAVKKQLQYEQLIRFCINNKDSRGKLQRDSNTANQVSVNKHTSSTTGIIVLTLWTHTVYSPVLYYTVVPMFTQFTH